MVSVLGLIEFVSLAAIASADRGRAVARLQSVDQHHTGKSPRRSQARNARNP
jgi:hypothetical protein